VHDLRNCLASVRAGASMLQNSGTHPAVVAKVADALQAQVREMVDLVDAFVGKRSVAEASLPEASSANAATLSVLVADDNADAASTLATFLRLEGHRVTVAFDGQQALQLAEADPPDVMLLDISMPTRDGYEVARTVRSQPWGANTRLIAVTGWLSQEDSERALDAGFHAQLCKPIDMDLLQRLLQP
jgi:CheY-like chemotaxis protein